MPGYDRTGPMGEGPGTGGGFGYCGPQTGRSPQRGFGMGRRMRGGAGFRRSGGFGASRRSWPRSQRTGPDFDAPLMANAEQEQTGLSDQLSFLKDEMADLKKQIAHLARKSGENTSD